MNQKECYIILYTIMFGTTIILYLKKWIELIQVRQHAIYVSVPMLWSSIFMLLLLRIYQIDIDASHYMVWGAIGASACYYWIGRLLFPSTKQIDSQNQFVYFDYYEHFRKQHQWIMGLALFALLLAFFLFPNKTYPPSYYSLFGFFGLAFFTEHKGLMCLLAWGTLSLFIFF